MAVKHPKEKIAELINRDFGSFEEFKNKFSETAIKLFGAGWAWLAQDDQALVRDRTYERCPYPFDRKQNSDPHAGRMGTRLLHRLPQCPSKVRRGILGNRQLGFCQQKFKIK